MTENNQKNVIPKEDLTLKRTLSDFLGIKIPLKHEIHEFGGHNNAIDSVSFSPDGK